MTDDAHCRRVVLQLDPQARRQRHHTAPHIPPPLFNCKFVASLDYWQAPFNNTCMLMFAVPITRHSLSSYHHYLTSSPTAGAFPELALHDYRLLHQGKPRVLLVSGSTEVQQDYVGHIGMLCERTAIQQTHNVLAARIKEVVSEKGLLLAMVVIQYLMRNKVSYANTAISAAMMMIPSSTKCEHDARGRWQDIRAPGRAFLARSIMY
ncbi:hypothetical protein BDZ89DRAFT_1115646 [Hymenopellis radicata]|nr:hypothetical protein BDZ89DRAFT_1115646 [Hymenopellis radicata]